MLTRPDAEGELLKKEDERDLRHFGYPQELFRTIGGFSNFAISFSVISILTGAATLYDYGLQMGGPADRSGLWRSGSERPGRVRGN